MPIIPQVLPSAAAVGARVAELIVRELRRSDARAPFVLGCPSGRTMQPTYEALASLAGARALDLSNVVILLMDEYVERGPDGELETIPVEAPHSCLRFGRADIVGRLNARVPEPAQIPPENLWVPDPHAPLELESKVEEAGGIAIFLLASGASDGHVAFNPPGAPKDSRTRVVELPVSTRSDNLATFPSFDMTLSKVPRYGVTVGIETIRGLSRKAVMVCTGSDKQLAVKRITHAAAYESDWPSTIVVECRDAEMIIDAAAGKVSDG